MYVHMYIRTCMYRIVYVYNTHCMYVFIGTVALFPVVG